jgi:hypothetical protein
MQAEKNQSLLKIAILFLVFAGVSLALLSVFLGDTPSKFTGKFMSICLISLLFGILAALSYGAITSIQSKGVALVSIIINVVGFLLSSLLIIFETKSAGMIRTVFALFVSGIALTQISRLYKTEIVNRYAYIARITASVCIALFTIIILITIFSLDIEAFGLFRSNPISETTGRSITAIFALDFCFTAATPLLNKMDFGRYETENIEDEFLKDIEN